MYEIFSPGTSSGQDKDEQEVKLESGNTPSSGDIDEAVIELPGETTEKYAGELSSTGIQLARESEEIPHKVTSHNKASRVDAIWMKVMNMGNEANEKEIFIDIEGVVNEAIDELIIEKLMSAGIETPRKSGRELIRREVDLVAQDVIGLTKAAKFPNTLKIIYCTFDEPAIHIIGDSLDRYSPKKGIISVMTEQELEDEGIPVNINDGINPKQKAIKGLAIRWRQLEEEIKIQVDKYVKKPKTGLDFTPVGSVNGN